MRRLSAILLLAGLMYSVSAPLLFADTESRLPECCRRKGAHQCAMAYDTAPTSGAAFHLLQRCPTFPAAPAVRGATVAFSSSGAAIFAGLVSHPAVQQQIAARGRVSFSRSRQKRGPPALLF